ncbi:hypothetical protein GMOD_00000025 [Pyrenophora seminiperda CCB06]|uniref:Uncharacterized protein n=1 Tax=Pyrenophora seminiperda CCB06 TaxID=1302712 RepID=A0A3M7M672_9PLEO|nr:hypothetical protein GMOD_00000025 [Pyrenophora seminiperda CCB06]
MEAKEKMTMIDGHCHHGRWPITIGIQRRSTTSPERGSTTNVVQNCLGSNASSISRG